MPLLQALAAVGSGLVAGLFLAFSVSVMPGLRGLPAGQGAAAMRAFNDAILNPVFLALFAGTALVSAALVVAVGVTGGSAGAAVGAALYLGGAIGVTAAVNVPMNIALAADEPAWERYLVRWTRWNHVRALVTAVATAFLVAS
ncbi:anthrone oxygenase family protein [Pseudonocardia sp.]|uniref:anthrone oxygenase family protein n=1 Tax=Pseudonocardia sp. TaxID=60912 RepID=UPI002610C30C|nr:anthrone oxygenase family protein [Pseudonocardia sp.]